MKKFMKKIANRFKLMKTSTKFVAAAVVAIVVFTIACFVILAATGLNIPDALIVAYYGFWTVEIVSLAAIKNTKTKNDNITVDDIKEAIQDRLNGNSDGMEEGEM